MWCIPPEQSAEFVYHMEDVLEVYHRPYDPRRPVVCMDETFKQLIGETREPLPAQPGAVERYDHVYTRNGVASLFMACEPLAGWRHVAATAQRCRSDWALFVRGLLDGRCRDAERVAPVMDQLNTHSPASLYQAFPPAEAKRLADRLEVHHTPKHGSWLNVAEIELSALGRQCLARRIAQHDTLRSTSQLGKTSATPRRPRSTGTSQPTRPASNSVASTHQLMTDKALGALRRVIERRGPGRLPHWPRLALRQAATVAVFDHVSITVADPAQSLPFWDAVMAGLGVPCVVRRDGMAGYGARNRPGDDAHTYLSIHISKGQVIPDNRHWCFRASNRAAVDVFHAAGLAARGRDDGAPGLRPGYHSAYYAAFLLDPDGNRIEAVCHQPAPATG